MHRIIFLIAFALALAAPAVILIGSIAAANRVPRHQSAIVIRMLVGLAAWGAVTVFVLFLMFVNVYSVAHTDYAYQHGRVNPDDAAKVDNFLAAVEAIYAIFCGSLGYYYARLGKRAAGWAGGGGAT